MQEELNIPEPKAKRDPRAMNAYRHGLTGQVLIFQADDLIAYDKFCEGMLTDLAPVGQNEKSLAQLIIDDRWRLHAAAAYENGVFAAELLKPDQIPANHEQIGTALSKARIWFKDAKQLANLSLYEGRIQRKLEKHTKELRELQAERAAALEKAVAEATLLAQLAASKGEAFQIEEFFEPTKFVFSPAQIAPMVTRRLRLAEAKMPPPAGKKELRKAA